MQEVPISVAVRVRRSNIELTKVINSVATCTLYLGERHWLTEVLLPCSLVAKVGDSSSNLVCRQDLR